MKFKQAKKLSHVPVTEVRLPTGKMSSRTGDNILYSDFLSELMEYVKKEIKKREKLDGKELDKRALIISIASIKYAMLKQDTNKSIIFNKEEALNFEGNTGPYLLYTYARARSILQKSKSKSKIKPKKIKDVEKELVIEMSRFPEAVLHAARNLAPNLIANYSYSLARKFNEFYHSSKVIGSDQEDFKLAIVDAFSIVLKNALGLLGIETIEKM